MIISLIAAMDNKRGIGAKNGLPWMGKVPADMKRFRMLTTDHTIIMGRKTYESLGRPLPNRRNIVLSRSDFNADGVEVFSSLNDALEAVGGDKHTEVFIIGGAQIFDETLAAADRLYLTLIEGEFDCDTFFPDYKESGFVIKEESSLQPDEKNLYPLRFVTLEKTVV